MGKDGGSRITTPFRGEVELRCTNITTEDRLSRVVYRSPVVNTRGRTVANAFVSVRIVSDTDPTRLLFILGGLSSSCGSPTAQGVEVQPGGRVGQANWPPGVYTFPLAPLTKGLPTSIVWQCRADGETQAQGRIIRLQFEGMIVKV